MGSAPEALEAEATADEAEALTLETTLEMALGPFDAAEEDALSRALEAADVIEAITEEMELALDMEADAEDAADDSDDIIEEADAEAIELIELAALAALSTLN